MKRNDVDDQPTPIVKLPQAHEYVQLLSKYVVEHSSTFSVVDVMNMQSFYGYIEQDVNFQHEQTLSDANRFLNL
jgi:hypothetical protein